MPLHINNLFKIGMLIVLGTYLNGCSSNGVVQPPENPNKDTNISLFTGKPVGTNILELGQEKAGPGSMPVNALLWRAA